MTPGWDWPRQPTSSGPTARGELDPGAKDRLAAALDRKLLSAGFVRGDGSRWQDGTKLGHLVATVFRSASGAHAGIAAIREFARGWAKRFGGNFTDVRVEGLGDESWRIREHLAYGSESVTYEWRRDNLVMEVHIQCIQTQCPSDVSRAARAWAAAVDEEAQTPP